MKQHFSALVFTVALAASTLAVSTARAADNNLAGRRAGIEQQVKEKLGLTDEQGQKIKAELAGEKEALKDIITRIATARNELREVIEKSGSTEADVRKAARKLADVEVDFAVLRFKLYDKIEPILTGDQKEKLKGMNASVDQFISRMVERAGSRLSQQ